MMKWRCIFQITILFIRMLKNLLFTSLAVELKKKCFCWFHTKMKNLKRFSYVNSWIWYSVCAIYRITDRHFKRHWEQLAIDSLILESNGVKNKNQHCIIRCSGKESLLWLSNTVNGIWFELMWAWNKEFYDLLYY